MNRREFTSKGAAIVAAMATPAVGVAAAIETRDETHEDYCGSCEGCGKHLFVGDHAFTYDDGPMTCEPCSPTWEDVKRAMDEQAADDTDEDFHEAHRHFTASYEAQRKAGEPLDEKLVHEL